MEQNINAPVKQLKTNRSLIKFILLSIITLGIYMFYFYTKAGIDTNTIASRYDGKKTMNFCLMAFIFTIITFGIAPFVWYHRLSNRIGNELARRGIDYTFNAGTFWLWNILGSLIIVGPFIYQHRIGKALNLLCEDYNRVG